MSLVPYQEVPAILSGLKRAADVLEAAEPVRKRIRPYLKSIPKAARMFRTRRKAYQGRRGKPRAHRTEPSQPQTTKQVGDLISGLPINIRNLSVTGLNWPTQGTDVGERLGTTISVSGLKICEQFHNDQAYPIVVHYALLQGKNIKGTLDAVGNSVPDFFRDNLGSPSRNRDFVNEQESIGNPYSFAYDCLPINPDHYHIITHKKRVLSAENTDVHWTWDTWKFDDYINLKGKRFTFESGADAEPQAPIFRVIWWQPLREQDWASPYVAPLPSITRQGHHVLYYKNALC